MTRSAAMKPLCPVLVLGLLVLSGCSLAQFGFPSHPAGAVATLASHQVAPAVPAPGSDTLCEIQSIDGAAVGSSHQLLPGHHLLKVAINHEHATYAGDVDLLVPAAKCYHLNAAKDGDSFTLSLVDDEAARPVATSTTAINDRMKFLVFVLQE